MGGSCVAASFLDTGMRRYEGVGEWAALRQAQGEREAGGHKGRPYGVGGEDTPRSAPPLWVPLPSQGQALPARERRERVAYNTEAIEDRVSGYRHAPV